MNNPSRYSPDVERVTEDVPRPLGSVSRARRASYAASSGFRLSKVGCPVAH